MKIQVPQNLNPVDILRKSGYGLVRDPRNPEQSFARRLGAGIYPRFHVYINEGNILNLHLDQKQASYRGSSAHSGEYEGETVEQETIRIQQMMDSMQSIPQEISPKEKKSDSLWSKLFG